MSVIVICNTTHIVQHAAQALVIGLTGPQRHIHTSSAQTEIGAGNGLAPSQAYLIGSTTQASALICANTTQTRIIAAGAQGPAGPQGEPGLAGNVSTTREATEVISALRVVVADSATTIRLADPVTTPTDSHIILGVATTAAGAPGEDVTVATDGAEVQDASWSWSAGPVWCADAGVLTQTPPASGASRVVAWAMTATRIRIQLREPYRLAS